MHTIGKTLDKMLDVFSNSSVLGPEGHAVVEAVVKSREEHAERVAQAAKEARVKQVESLLRFQQVTGDHEGKRERVQAPGSELSAARAELAGPGRHGRLSGMFGYFARPRR
ncbi:hypothetical protein [Arsenicicoccus sp. oral taxon 190]|uniref:hypothetical protein n=1 Tax=Arsenicicoccus sp. oral taxon 190 TaxID=1658671 RepID=UPI00067A106A|nr:hypothetical protein [Arsenicicoccus sp. oral taxon 190]AKT50953.1 hypothetical protein ADJ73_05835 [Arsenicicoccus sp. oral taxon 190]